MSSNDAEDVDHLATVTDLGRVLISRDKDFARLHVQGDFPHAGILRIVKQKSIGQIIEAAQIIYGASTAEEMRGAIIYR
ncbi:hypothetical protein AYO38_00925 [bacterium SCGC AG-212-C10]|nr:hypothetical protein AYO38_00925 [bacterium SCGC AG-212-C10]